MSGKGSKPRPYSVTQQEYDNRWDAIFGKDKDNMDTTKECVLDSDIEKISRYNEETEKIKRISP